MNCTRLVAKPPQSLYWRIFKSEQASLTRSPKLFSIFNYDQYTNGPHNQHETKAITIPSHNLTIGHLLISPRIYMKIKQRHFSSTSLTTNNKPLERLKQNGRKISTNQGICPQSQVPESINTSFSSLNFEKKFNTTTIIPKRHYAGGKYYVTDEPVVHMPDFQEVERPRASQDINKTFSYTLIGAAGVVGALAGKSMVSNLLASWSASGEALSLAKTEVDLTVIPEGKSVVIKWRGMPVFIRHRTPSEIVEAAAVPLSELRDPQSDAQRTQKPEWIVMVGICTHLGCVPIANSGDYNGWFCPCHGSHYDISGRIRKGPAPTNLEIPFYQFTGENSMIIG